ncbi:hypothetical protein ACFLRB_01370 [Acidobacteriota bacterium]
MGKTKNEYTVFIASPGGVKEEREIVHQVCGDLTEEILADQMIFKAVGWENAVPEQGRPRRSSTA